MGLQRGHRHNTTGLYTITAVLAHSDTVLVDLTIDGEPLTTTPEHPFFTRERSWVPADDLRLGDHIRAADGSWGIVERWLLRDHTQVMYNLTVATAHTFFVGDGQWLVHNQCANGPRVRNIYHEEIGNLEGTIKNQETFASGNAINEIQRLVDQYGGHKKEWRKVKGEGLVITDTGLARTAELHWYERKGVRVEIRVKRWIN